MRQRSESGFCSVAEAARILEVSPVTVWRWIAAKLLPAYRVGPRNIRIKRDDLASMIKPARIKEVSTEEERVRIEPAAEGELARRKALVAQILAKSKERVIAPLTSADLVHKVREDERRSRAR